MLVEYADEVRRKLKQIKRRIQDQRKELNRKKTLLSEHLALLQRILLHGQGGSTFTDPIVLASSCNKLVRDINEIESALEDDLRGQAALAERLKAAPKRKMIRKKESSIAASGTKAFNAAIKAGQAMDSAKADAETAALETSKKKYKLPSIPKKALRIMEARRDGKR